MTDRTDDTTPDTIGEPQAQPSDVPAPAVRRPSPGAQAASRARRIGGRPSPGPRQPDTAVGDAGAQTAVSETSDRASATTPAGREAGPDLRKPKAGAPDAAVPAAEAAVAAVADDAAALRRRLDRLRWVPAGVLALFVAVLAAVLVVSSHGVWWAKPSTGSVRSEVLAAAKTCLASTNSFDYRKLDDAEAAGLRCATGKFRDAYKQSMETVIKKIAPQRQASQTVQVNKAGIESVSNDGKQWVILIYGQQQVTNNTTAKNQPRLDLLAAKVTMDKVGDKWLISALSAA